MKQFTIFIENKTREIVKVSEAIGRRGVNIKAIVSESSNTPAFVKLVTNDVQTTQKALSEEGFEFELKEILSLEMDDRPGELFKVAKRLERARINIESIYILGQNRGKTELALVVDDIERARKVLKP